MEAILDAISARVPKPESEYIGEDGLLHCSVCHERTERINIIPDLGINRKARCACACVRKKNDAHDERLRQEEYERKRKICFYDTNMANWNFENDDRKKAKLSDAMQNYVKDFTEHMKDGMGLLLYGSVGTGKTYYAASIANALLDKDVRVLFRTFKQIERDLWNAENKGDYMRNLNRYSLLIFDDLGAERDSKYMADIVFDIVDTRYKSGLPFIVTTNLTADELKKPQDVGHSRIYDRILERCHPIAVDGGSRRRQNVIENFESRNRKLGL